MADLRLDAGSLEQARSDIARAAAAGVSGCVPATDFGSLVVAEAFSEVDVVLSAASRGLDAVLLDAGEAVRVVDESMRAEDVRLGQQVR